MCTPDGETYTINAIWVDGDGDIYLHSTDTEDDLYEYTAWNILKRLNKHYPKTYVYFKPTDEDGESYCWDIENNWYIHTEYDDDYDMEVDSLYLGEMD